MTTPEQHVCAPITVRIQDIRESFQSDAEAEAAARLIIARAATDATNNSWVIETQLDALQSAVAEDRAVIDAWIRAYAGWKKREAAYKRWQTWDTRTAGICRIWMKQPSRGVEPTRPTLGLGLGENYPDAISVMKAYVALEERGYVIINREKTRSHTIVATRKLTDVLKTTVPLGLLIDTKADEVFISPENLAIAA